MDVGSPDSFHSHELLFDSHLIIAKLPLLDPPLLLTFLHQLALDMLPEFRLVHHDLLDKPVDSTLEVVEINDVAAISLLKFAFAQLDEYLHEETDLLLLLELGLLRVGGKFAP